VISGTRIGALAALAALLAGCGEPHVPPRVTGRLVIVGVDGATWNIMSPLMSRGQLPRLASLVEAGSAGRLRATPPLLTAPLWTTVVTGRPPGSHGILTDTLRSAGRYALRPVTADMRRTPALWTIATSRDVTVGAVGWPATFPAEEVKGFMVSEEWDPELAASPRGAHPERAIGPDTGDEDRLTIPDRLLPVAALSDDLRGWFERDLQDLSRGLALYRVHQPAIALFRFRSIDGASHRFWAYMERRFLQVMAGRGDPVAPDLAAARARAIPGAYEMFDAWIGMLIERLPEDATLLIVSDHGFRGIQPDEDLRVDMNLLLRKLGYQTATPAGETDWDRTRAFALAEDGSGRRGVFLNIRGREAKGSLDPASADGVLLELAKSLEGIADAGGRKLFGVEPAVRHDAHAWADPGATDLWVAQAPGFGSDSVLRIGGAQIAMRDIAKPTGVFGVHDATGIVLAVGRGIAPGKGGWEAEMLDVLPTALHLAGLPPSSDLPGSVMENLLADPSSESSRLVSYDGLTAAPPAVLMPVAVAERGIGALQRCAHLMELTPP